MGTSKNISLILIGLSLVNINLTAPAWAATKCVKLTTSTSCSSTPVVAKSSWSASCNGTNINGVGICSSKSGSIGQQESELMINNNSDTGSSANIYCWCKMVRPAVSYWIYGDVHANASTCSFNCSFLCASALKSSGTAGVSFRAAMFSNLSD